MIDQQLINMLDDPNPQVREKAVKQLAKTQSQEAVQYLAVVYKTDDDPDVRELARKAGLYIKKKMTEEKWTGGEGDPNAMDDSSVGSEEIEVSQRAIDTSISQMETAMNLHMAGDDEKAAKQVEKAFMSNPNLQNDTYYLGMAATILGMRGEDVPQFLLGDVEFDAKGKAKRKRKPKNIEGEISTETVIIDLVIFWIVMAAILIIGTLIQFQILSNLFETLMASPEFASEFSSLEGGNPADQIALYSNLFLSAGILSAVISSFISSLISVVFILIQYAFIHFSATSILSGEGTFKGLIHKLTNYYTITYAISAIAGYFMMYLTINSIATSFDNPEAALGTITNLSWLYFGAVVGWFVYLSHLIGKNYEFGTTKGCVTVIISTILMTAISCACMFIFSAALGQMIASMMGGASGF